MTTNIHTAIHEVYKQTGYVQKKGKNNAQNYRYAGEKDLIEALRPAMLEQGIIFYCSGMRDLETRELRKVDSRGDEKLTIHSVGTFEFTFTHAESSTSIVVMSRGEGTDSLDKASYKAMTGALKYALRQTFVIETGDDPDEEPAPKRQAPQQQRQEWPAPDARPSAAPKAAAKTGQWTYTKHDGSPCGEFSSASELIKFFAEVRWNVDLALHNRAMVNKALDAAIAAKAAKPGNSTVAALHTQAQEVMRTVLDLLGESDTVDEGMVEQPELEPA